MAAFGGMLGRTRRQFGDRLALQFDDREWSYAQLDDASMTIAANLATAGVQSGDRLALFMPNCDWLVLGYLACFRLGAIAVPLNYRYRAAEVEYALRHCGASTLLVHRDLLSEVASLPLEAIEDIKRVYVVDEPTPSNTAPQVPLGMNSFNELLLDDANPFVPAEFEPSQAAAILYTSGTTAKPKGVTYTYATLLANCEIQAETFAFTPDDVHLVSTAACHAAAFTGQLLPSLFVGSACVLRHLPKPASVVEACHRFGVTRLQMLPASLADLVEFREQHPEPPLPMLRCCTAGGDVVPAELQERFCRAFGWEITELYGMTEALSCITNDPFGPKRHGSIGKPVARTRVKIAGQNDEPAATGETGELLVQSPATMVGYWHDAVATEAALAGGWLHTGDLARQDEEGFLYFVGRRKEIIIHGGSNISPLEVEEAIDAHPAVHLSGVVGMHDNHWGEIVVAYVALRDAAAAPTAQELHDFVAQRVATYKVPERFIFLPEMPLNATGKIDRQRLHALASRQASVDSP